MKKNVIFVIPSMAGGGAERVISILANHFVKQEIGTTILMTAGDTVVYELDPAVKLVSAGGRSGGSFAKRLERIRNMRRVFREGKDSVVISFGPDISFWAVCAEAFLRHPFLISERNDPAACKYPFLRNLVYSRADKLVYQTADALECFPKYLQKKGCVIPNPVKEGLAAPWFGERQKTVAAVGRLEEQKNHRMLLEAFSVFYKKHPDYKLHIYGKGVLQEELQKLAEKLGITEAVVWEGFCTDVLERIHDAGMYALSSDYEGISNSLLEAMAIGLPAVSTDCPIGGSRMCIQDGENGLLVPCRDAQAFAQALDKLASDQEFAAKLGRNAAKIRETYSEKVIADKWVELVQELGSKSGR